MESPARSLATAFAVWTQTHQVPHRAEPAAVRLTLETPPASGVTAEPPMVGFLTAAEAAGVAQALSQHTHAVKAAAVVRGLIAEVAAELAAAAAAGLPVGAVLAAAVHQASVRLWRPWYLVRGRPGSWEADIVERMSAAVPAPPGTAGEAQVVDRIADRLIQMATNSPYGLDGGEALSQALGQAADRLGSVRKLVDLAGAWGHDVDNLTVQYASDAARVADGGTPLGRPLHRLGD